MQKAFTDIKIVAFDETATHLYDRALYTAVLILSDSASEQWQQYFNKSWQDHIYMKKRRATCIGNRIEIICVPSELQDDHIPELNVVVARTNEAFRQYLEKVRLIDEEQKEKERKEREMLASVKNNLKFD